MEIFPSYSAVYVHMEAEHGGFVADLQAQFEQMEALDRLRDDQGRLDGFPIDQQAHLEERRGHLRDGLERHVPPRPPPLRAPQRFRENDDEEFAFRKRDFFLSLLRVV